MEVMDKRREKIYVLIKRLSSETKKLESHQPLGCGEEEEESYSLLSLNND